IAVESTRLLVGKPSVGFPSFTISASEAGQGAAGPFSWGCCAVSEVDLGQGMGTAWLDLDKLEFPLRIRPWQVGDRMRPLGLGGSKRISDMLVDAGVQARDKAGAYVLLSGARILWLPGLRIAEECTPDAHTKNVFRVTFRPGRDHHLEGFRHRPSNVQKVALAFHHELGLAIASPDHWSDPRDRRPGGRAGLLAVRCRAGRAGYAG